MITVDQFARRLAKGDPVLRMCLAVVLERYRQTVARVDPMTMPGLGVDRAAEAGAGSTAHMRAALEALSVESELRRALRDDEFELFFQPIVRLGDRAPCGFEALLRWNHPERGLVNPSAFIPIAEASGMIVDVTAWVLARIGRLFPALQAAGAANPALTEPLWVSVNISGQDLSEPRFLDQVTAMLDETGMTAAAVKLEITESVLMNEPLKAAAVLRECRSRGLMIAIDDFGTGYSSLSHLSTLPINTIKIDQSFVRSMLADETSRKIVHMILRLAGELGIPVVAEGIEGQREADQLALLGCALGQGFLFGRPAPLQTTLGLLRTWTPGAAPTLAADRPDPLELSAA